WSIPRRTRALPIFFPFARRTENRGTPKRASPAPGAPSRTKRATISCIASAYGKFESISLQQTVRLRPGFASVRGKARVFSHFAEHAGRQLSAETRKARQHRAGAAVVSLSGYIPVPQCCRVRFAISAAVVASEVGWLGGSDLGGALSSNRLKQSRAGSVDP